MRVYGKFRGNNSWSVVGRGMAQAAGAEGLLSGTYDPNDEEPSAGGEDPAALCTGLLVSLDHALMVPPHRKIAFLLAPNCGRIPEDALRSVCRADVVLSPSSWGKDVILSEIERHGITPKPVVVCQHGVDMGDEVPAPPVLSGPMRFLHMVAGLSYGLERKGTYELLEAWKLWAPTDAELHIVADPEGAMMLRDYLAAELHVDEAPDGGMMCRNYLDVAPTVHVHNRVDLAGQTLVSLYQSHHYVIQPSRVEGFGMVPLEALCCGVPVVLTAGTGHLEYLTGGYSEETRSPAAVRIPIGADSQMWNNNLGPSVAPADILDALERARAHYEVLRRQADASASAMRCAWSWHRRAGDWCREFQKAAEAAEARDNG